MRRSSCTCPQTVPCWVTGTARSSNVKASPQSTNAETRCNQATSIAATFDQSTAPFRLHSASSGSRHFSPLRVSASGLSIRSDRGFVYIWNGGKCGCSALAVDPAPVLQRTSTGSCVPPSLRNAAQQNKGLARCAPIAFRPLHDLPQASPAPPPAGAGPRRAPVERAPAPRPPAGWTC